MAAVKLLVGARLAAPLFMVLALSFLLLVGLHLLNQHQTDIFDHINNFHPLSTGNLGQHSVKADVAGA